MAREGAVRPLSPGGTNALQALEAETMDDNCELRIANGIDGQPCDGEDCIYWRVVEHLGEEKHAGCAIQHFEMLGDSEIAAWLLSVKERLEGQGTRETEF